MSLHNFNSNTKSWKMYTNTLTSISGDDLLVAPSYGNNLILEVSANNDIFFKKGDITKGFGNIVSDYLDVSFVREASFNSLNSQMQYVLQEISGISNDLLDTSYNIILSGGVFIQNNEYASYDILDITGKIIFTDNSTNVQRINDISLNNVDICGSLNVAGSISAPNIYTKTEIDASFSNVYTKLDVLDSSLANVITYVDASFSNVYTKLDVLDVSLANVITRIDASFSNVYTKLDVLDVSLANVITRVDASFSNVYTKLDVLDSSLANVITYVDASFSNVYTKLDVLDVSLANVITYVDASFSNVYTKLDVLDVSLANVITYVDASFSNVYTKLDVLDSSLDNVITYVDASFSNVYTKLDVLDVSLANVITRVDASFSNVYTKLDVLDSSLANVITRVDASFSNIYTKLDVLDSSLANVITYVDASFSNVYTKLDVLDSSLANVITYVDASFTNVYTKLDALDVSLANVITYVDASFSNVYTKAEVDVSFVSKELFDASLSSIQLSNVYTKAEVDVSFVSKELFDASLSDILLDGLFIQNNDYASYDILDITGKIIFTDNSTNVQRINDVSLNNVDISGSLKVTGTINAPNIYTKTEIDASFSNVYTKNQVYTKTEIDNSFTNVYTRGQVDISFVSKELFDASLSSIQVSNVYTKNEVDVSFVSKQLFETSYNVLLSAIGTGGGSGGGTSSIAKKFYNQDWNLLGTNITKVKDVSGSIPAVISASLDGYTIMVYWPYSTIFYPTGVGSQEQARTSIAVYTFISNSWVQKGETILFPFTYIPSWRYAESGGAGGDQAGLATDFNISGKYMSGDGNTIAIPISRAGYGENTGEYLNNIYTDVVYSFNGTAWIQIASVTSQNSNRAGNTYFTFENNVIKRFLIGVGGSLTNVIIHTLTNGSFVQDSAQISESEVNTSINVPGSLEFWSRRTRAISADGKVVLFCKQNSMVLFKYNGTIWQQYGNVTLITLPTWSTTTGKLSNDGSVFLVGSWDSTVNGDTYAGRSKIYAYDSSSNTWIQRGQDIVYEEVQYIDEAQGIQFGSDTKLLSGDGLTVAFGGRNRPSVIYNNDGGSNYYSGYLQAYRYSSVSNYWSKIGREITGVTMERPGQFVASSYNGNVIHIDGQSFKETSTSVDTGRIRVYEIEV